MASLPLPVLPIRISPSRVETASRCYRRHFLENVLEVGRDSSAAAAFGNVVHVGAAEVWHARQGGADKREQYVEASEALQEKWIYEAEDQKHSLSLALSMLEAYVERAELAGLMRGEWRIVDIERRSEISLPNGAILRFKIDRLVEEVHGDGASIMDTKTSSYISDRWRDQMQNSTQQKLYRWAAQREFGRPIEFPQVEGLEKMPGHRIEYVELGMWDDETIYEAVALAMTAADQDTLWVRRLHQLKGDLVEFFSTFFISAPFNSNDCYSYGRKCQYLDSICMQNMDVRIGNAVALPYTPFDYTE